MRAPSKLVRNKLITTSNQLVMEILTTSLVSSFLLGALTHRATYLLIKNRYLLDQSTVHLVSSGASSLISLGILDSLGLGLPHMMCAATGLIFNVYKTPK